MNPSINVILNSWVAPFGLFLYFLTLRLSNGQLNAKVVIFSTIYDYTSVNSLVLQEWNRILFSIKYDSGSIAEVYVNTLKTSGFYLTNYPLLDEMNTLMIIGMSSSAIDYFEGYMYSFNIYVQMPEISELASAKECEDCLVCSSNGNCLPNCEILMFFDEESFQCLDCKDEYIFRCSSPVNCTYCIDPNCVDCKNFEMNSFIECEEGSEVLTDPCGVSGFGEYYDT